MNGYDKGKSARLHSFDSTYGIDDSGYRRRLKMHEPQISSCCDVAVISAAP